MVYVIQREDIDTFGPARDIDPVYSETLVKAYNNGVEIIPLQAKVSPIQIELGHEIDYELMK